MRVLVTGAGGFFGSKLVERLVLDGHEVRTFGRSPKAPPALAQLRIEHVQGDVTAKETVRPAVKDTELVFHLAGLVSYRKCDLDRQHQVNVVGTRHVMECCLDAGVKRVIFTGSIAGMGIPAKGTIGTEEMAYNLHGKGLNYCDSKYEAEQVVHEMIGHGLPAIILNPGITFGEGDSHPHHRAIFLSLSRAGSCGYPPGGVTFCDINDVVDVHINAMTMGRLGERYVVGSANVTYKEAAGIVCRLLGKREPSFQIPAAVISALGIVCENLFPLFGQVPPLTKQGTWLSQREIFFSFDKAIKELGLKPTPFEQTVRRTIKYYLTGSLGGEPVR